MHYRLFWALILMAGADGFGADESLTGKPAAITGEAKRGAASGAVRYFYSPRFPR